MKPRWLTAVVALSAALMTLDMTVVTIALPDITREFSAGLEDAQWIVNAYVLVFAALLLGVGALSDRMPRHRLFMLGHLIFAASSLLCALSGSSGTLIAGRVCQAVGATLVFGTCMPLIADTHEGDDAARSRAVGAFMAAGAAAAALGPLVGGLLVGGGGWRWIFAVNVPVSLIAVVVMGIVAPNKTTAPRQSTGRDWVSTALVAVGLFGATTPSSPAPRTAGRTRGSSARSPSPSSSSPCSPSSSCAPAGTPCSTSASSPCRRSPRRSSCPSPAAS